MAWSLLFHRVPPIVQFYQAMGVGCLVDVS
jgi:hypothetical protein